MMRGVRALRWLRERRIELKKWKKEAPANEKWGYFVWSLMGLVILVPEVKAVGQDCNFDWPTISTTVGYLQHKLPVLALIPVALIVMASYFVFRLEPSRPPQIVNDDHLIVRTPEGRRVKVEFTSYEQLAPSASVGGNALIGTTRTPWRGLYFLVALVVVALGWFLAIRLSDRYVTGYVLYGLIAVFWVIVPNVAARWLQKDAQFTTLVYTIGILGRRLPIVAALTASLVVILLLHIALYPWPARNPPKFCLPTETTNPETTSSAFFTNEPTTGSASLRGNASAHRPLLGTTELPLPALRGEDVKLTYAV